MLSKVFSGAFTSVLSLMRRVEPWKNKSLMTSSTIVVSDRWSHSLTGNLMLLGLYIFRTALMNDQIWAYWWDIIIPYHKQLFLYAEGN